MQWRPKTSPAKKLGLPGLGITWVYNATIPHPKPFPREVPLLGALPAPPCRGKRIPATHKHSFLKWRPLHGGRVKKPSGTGISHLRSPHVSPPQQHSICPLGPRLRLATIRGLAQLRLYMGICGCPRRIDSERDSHFTNTDVLNSAEDNQVQCLTI